MTKHHEKTVRIRRAARVAQDERGQNVWVGAVETVELELMSTAALERILESGDGRTQSEIRKLAAGSKDGVLARETATGHFRIVSDAELESALDAENPRDHGGRRSEVTAEPINEKTRHAADQLSLVSTQVLRKVLKPAEKTGDAGPKSGKRDPFGGFDPYDNN